MITANTLVDAPSNGVAVPAPGRNADRNLRGEHHDNDRRLEPGPRATLPGGVQRPRPGDDGGLLAEDVVEHGIHETLHGVDGIFDFLEAHFRTFPDYTGVTEPVIAEGDLVAVRYTASGTHTGEYRDVGPTGHTVEWTGMAVYRIADDRIAEIWLEEDRLGLLEQLEVVDPPAHLRL